MESPRPRVVPFENSTKNISVVSETAIEPLRVNNSWERLLSIPGFAGVRFNGILMLVVAVLGLIGISAAVLIPQFIGQ